MIDDDSIKHQFLLFEAARDIFAYLMSKEHMGIISGSINLPMIEHAYPRLRIQSVSKKMWKKVLYPEIKRCADPFRVKVTHIHKGRERKHDYTVMEVRMPKDKKGKLRKLLEAIGGAL